MSTKRAGNQIWVCTIALTVILTNHLVIAEEVKGGDLESHLKLLNMWSTRTDWENDLYSKIYTVLAEDKASSYGDIADDQELQTIFQDRDIRHLGGPMLGCVTPHEVKVWLRTTKPAQVKVTVDVEGEERVFGPV